LNLFLGFLLTELSKDKPLTKQVENHTQIFIKSMEQLETGFQQQITYLTTVATGYKYFPVFNFLTICPTHYMLAPANRGPK